MMKFAFTSLTVMTTLICYSSVLEAGRFWSSKSDDDKTAGTSKPPHFVHSIDFKRTNESDVETIKLNLEGLTDEDRTTQVANARKQLQKLEKKHARTLKNGKDLSRDAQTEMDEYIAILIANEMIEKEIQTDTETRRRTILQQSPLNAGNEADFPTHFPPLNLDPFPTKIQTDTETRRRAILQTPLNAGNKADFSTSFPPFDFDPFPTNFPPIPDTDQKPSSR